jgi:hypothetical protein
VCRRYLVTPTHNTTHNTGPKSIMNEEYNWVFVYNGDTYNYTPSIENFNHTLKDLTFFNSAAEITTIQYLILL